MTPNLTDDEVDDICAGLVQSAAKIRFLTALGLHCLRKPNGAPLVNRAHFDRVMGSPEKAHTGASSGPVWGVH
jgi:hypothetical protein